MQTDALKLAEHNANVALPERLSLATIELQVTDLDRALRFWTEVLGLRLRVRNEQRATLGTEQQTLIVLHAGATRPVSGRHLGMYHVAIRLSDQAEFSRILKRLIDTTLPISVVDHLMSKAIYVQDPDGLEVEFAFETPERFSHFGDLSKGLVMYDTEGRPHSGRASLNVSSELAYAKDTDPSSPLNERTCIAHLHLKVADLESTTRWFENIGFARNLMLPGFGFADLGAGAAYTHRMAMNIWNGTDLSPTPNDMAGLINYTLVANDPRVIENATTLQKTAQGMTGVDPAGTPLTLLSTQH